MLFRFASDEHLVARVRAGSAAAFETLFDRHHRPLLAFCRHMLGSAADAEDAVQHTFMAAYADLMRSEKPIALRPWLYSIARHRCLSMLRARRERPLAELPEPDVDHLASDFDTREELRATLADIAHLPDDQRAALILAELGDASHAEIAQILGCRQEKVKALVFQARTTLAAGRTARDTPCAEIREQLTVGGVAIRRTSLRHHVRACAGCREYREHLRLQRRRLRILLPIAPSLGLKRAVLGAVCSSGGGGALSGVTAAVGTLGMGGLAATAIVSVAVAGGREPAPTAAPATAERTRPAMTSFARGADPPQRVAPVARARSRRPAPVTRTRRQQAPVAAAPQRRTAPAGVPGAQPKPAPSGPQASPAAPPPQAPEEAAAAPPAANRKPAEPPGQEKRANPPEPPAKAPPTPPGGGKPAEPPGGGKPAEPPGNGGAGPPAGGPDQQPPPDGPPPGASDPRPAPARR
jgi:RNA polymerase sigma factor (sigma-70 family)